MATRQEESQAAVVALLASGAERCIDTHAARIFLAGDRAWKLKRAVRYDYLDFSTADQRRAALDDELRLNRRTAPMLYRAVHPITDAGDGRVAIGGEGRPVDWVLEMTRFPDGALLAEQAALSGDLMLRLADGIAAFHAGAEIGPREGGAARFAGVVEGNVVSLEAQAATLDPARVARLATELRGAAAVGATLLDARAMEGRVRHVHGDLHLANIALVDGAPVAFDCLEFDSELATIDTLYDLAFLLMDLWQRGWHDAANILFNRYLDLTGADEGGLALMPLFLAVRAAIRAHVMAAQGKPGEATGFLDLALALLRAETPRLVAIGGLSGSGKSTLARAIGGAVGRAPGARILRSDVLRKRLAGLLPEQRLSTAAYTADASATVYGELARLARDALRQGQSVIADAVFARPAERAAMARLAPGHFIGIWLDVDVADRASRVGSRGPDASDADLAVVAAQANYAIGDPGDWHVLPARGPIDDIAGHARELLNGPDICPVSG